METRVSIDTTEAEAVLKELKDRAPRNTLAAMNRTVNDVQRAIQAGLDQQFTLRRPEFVRRTIYRKPGEDFPDFAAGIGVAAVRIHDDRNQLAKFVEGGTKTARSGQVAVPLIRQQQPKLIIERGHRYHLRQIPKLADGATVRGSPFFRVVRNNVPVIMERVGRRVKAIWAFVRSVPIRKQLPFYETAHQTVRDVWDRNLREELAETLRKFGGQA